MYDIIKLKELASMFHVEVDLWGTEQDRLTMSGKTSDINKFWEAAERRGLLAKDPFDESYNPEDTSWMDDLIDALRTYPSNNEIENDAFLKELRELYYKYYPNSDKIIEEETLMERMDFDTLYKKVKEQDRPIQEGLFGTLLFNTSFANELYDEFYRPLTDLIKKGDKEGALKEWEDLKKDFEQGGLEKKKWAKTFVEVQKARMEKYKAQIDAMEDAKVEEPALVESSITNATRAIKDTDYVIVLNHPETGRNSFLGKNYRITANLNNAMPYSSKFEAEDDIKYAEDAALQTMNSEDDFYRDRFTVVTAAEAKKLQGIHETQYQYSKRMKESMDSDTRSIEIVPYEDCDECPYLLGEDSNKVEISNRYELSEDELWATGWIGAVQNCNVGPFNSFDELDIYCYDREKGVEYDLPEIPEDIKSKFVTEVNKYIEEVGVLEEGYKPHTKRLLKLIGSDKLEEQANKAPIDYKFKIQVGIHTPTRGKYYFIYPERKNPTILPQEIWDQLSVTNENATHFNSVAEAKEWINDNLVQQYNIHPIYESYMLKEDSEEEYDDYEESYTPISEDIDDEYHSNYKAENVEFVMNEYITDEFGVESITKINDTTYKVIYDGTEVEIIFDFGWDEWVYTINGKGPFSHSSYEWLISDIRSITDQESIDESFNDFGDLTDKEAANELGGEMIYCDTCGTKLAFDEYGSYCPKCSQEDPLDDTIEELHESGFDTHSDIDLDMVGIRIANLLDEDNLGDDWIEFDCKDSRGLIGTSDLHMSFEATGSDKVLRGYMRAHTDDTIDVYITNGSEGKFRSPREIARFIAGEFGLFNHNI